MRDRLAYLLRDTIGDSSLLRRAESWYLKDKPPDCDPPIFLVGPPRSGSTLLTQLITSHYRSSYFTNLSAVFHAAPALVARITRHAYRRNAIEYFKSDYGLSSGLWAPAEAGGIRRHWYPDDAEESIDIGLARRTVRNLTESMGSPFVWKNLNNSFYLESLHTAFPDALFVELRRDLTYCCQSIYFGIVEGRGINIQGIREEDRPDGFSLLSHIARGVLRLQRVIADFTAATDCNHLVIQYEDLCNEAPQVLRTLESTYEATGKKLVRLRDYGDLVFTASKSIKLSDEDWAELNEALQTFQTA